MRLRVTPLLTLLSLAIVLTVAGCGTGQRRSTNATAQPQVSHATQKTTVSRGWPTHHSSGSQNWTARAYPTGEARTSAIGIEKGVPTEVRLNSDFQYQIVVTNLTDDTLENVVVRDVPGNSLKLKSSDPKGRITGGEATWNLGDFGPRETRVINVTATAMAEGTVGSCAEVSYDTLLCMTVPVVSPKLILTKRGPAEVLKCEPINYQFEVKNTGTGTLSGVKINDPLPAGLKTTDGKSTITFNVGSLQAGQSRKYTAKVMAERTGKFTNSASATGGGLTAKSGDVVTTVRAPKLSIEKSCPKTVFIGRPIEYKLTIKNIGDGDARDTVINDRLPAGATRVTASDGGKVGDGHVRWNLGTMKPGATRTVTIKMTPRTAGSLRNTAMASAFCADQVTDTCVTEVTGIPAILLEVIDLEDPVAVGDNTTYVITVTNQGSANGTNIRLVCTLEPNQELVSATGATSGTGRGKTVTFASLASLAPKQKATFRVVVRNVKAGDVRFHVSMTSDQLSREVAETEATNVYE